MDAQAPIVFYDIASGPPVRPFAPNPWKARYALNFKGVHYRTQWVELPDVTPLRQSLGVPPSRFFADGTPYYTLPIIYDPSTDTYVGDSFDIAVYLDKTYPNGPTLLPDDTIGLHASFNKQVDEMFSQYAGLLSIPFNPATAEISKALYVERFKVKSWEDLLLSEEARVNMLTAFEKALGEFSKVFKKKEEGPFLEGKKVTYADLIVGGWLQMLQNALKEWDQVKEWQGGMWVRLLEALQVYAAAK